MSIRPVLTICLLVAAVPATRTADAATNLWWDTQTLISAAGPRRTENHFDGLRSVQQYDESEVDPGQLGRLARIQTLRTLIRLFDTLEKCH